MTGSTVNILDLWPTKLVKKMLPDYNDPNRELLKLARNWDKTKKDLTTDYKHNNPFEIDEPATNWLRENVNQVMIEYLRAIGIDFSVVSFSICSCSIS